MSFWQFLDRNASGIGAIILAVGVAVTVVVGIGHIVTRPGAWEKSQYNECLKIILAHYSLAEAETMCAHFRTGN